MGFLKKISELLLGSDRGEIKDPDGIYLYFRCDQCGSPIRIRVDKRHDLQRDYDSGGLLLSKEIMDGKCFRLIHAQIRFDAAYHITNSTVEGGTLITWDDYQQLVNPSSS